MEELDKERLKELWDNGESVDSIVRQFPYEKRVVMKAIVEMRKNGELLERTEKKKSFEQKIVALYKSGVENPYEIAKEVGCAYTTVQKAFDRNHIKRKRPPHNYKERVATDITKLCETTQNIIEALKYGHPKSKIAQWYGVSRQWVHTVEKTYIKGIKRKLYLNGKK
jgi:DNA invertase Pin-like site-specific DNA recombinase